MKKQFSIIQMMGAVLLLIGAMLQITHWEFSPYIYVVGAVLFAWIQVAYSRYEGNNLIIKRLRRQQIIGAMLLVFTGVLMFVSKRNEWIICLTISAVLQLYTAYRIPVELEKEQ